MSRWYPAVLIALIAGGVLLPAQQYTHLSGLIRDPSEAAVQDASLTVVNEDTGFRRTAVSRADGSYVIASLQPGIYKITARKEGFRTVIQFGVKLEVAQAARCDFTLPLGSVQETITVEGTQALLNKVDASVGTLVSREWIERLPLNGRGLLSLLEMAPGTVVTPATRGESGQFSTNGQRPNTNYFTVDGVSVNSGVSGGGVAAQVTGGALPGMTALGSFHNIVPLDALDEFRVQTATTSPEFGRMPGAQVSLSSRSGTNDFHGSLFHYLRHEYLDANDWFANRNRDPRAPLRMNDLGGGIGGPIRKNRTFFFAAYEAMRLRQPFSWRQPSPTIEARTQGPAWVQRVLGFFPVPDGPSLGPGLAEWNGRVLRPSRLDTASLRIDHALTSRIAIFARYNETPSSNQFGAAQINSLHLTSRGITAGFNLRIKPNAILDIRLNRSHMAANSEWRPTSTAGLPPCYLEPITLQFRRQPGICDYLVRFGIAGVGQVAVGRESDRTQNQWHLLPTADLHFKGHQLRIGADLRQLTPTREDLVPSVNILVDSLTDLYGSGNQWAAHAPQTSRSEGRLREVSLFAQDTWRLHPRLTLTFGLRWEFSPAPLLDIPRIPDDIPPIVLFGDQTKLWPDSLTNLAPRVGLAWQPSANGKTVVRGGYGIFYDSSLSIATDIVNSGPFNIASEFTSGRNAPFSVLLQYGFLPDLRLPQIRQWSFAVERSLADRDIFSLTYTGSEGRYLMRRELGAPGSNESLRLVVATNHGNSEYHGLQFLYRRLLWKNFQGHAAYSWSHSIDNSSTDSGLHWAEGGFNAARDRGSSDFDVRHSFNLAFTYQSPVVRSSLWRGWALDGIFRARTGFPINVLNAEHTIGLNFANAFRPNYTGAPVWLSDNRVPNGRKLNPLAFTRTTGTTQGNLGRNVISGFGMNQMDLALRREFRVTENTRLQFRVEAFNAFNHPNFAEPVRFLASPLFGESSSMLNLMLGTGSPGSGLTPVFQNGGARSFQTVLRFRF
jgi:hypothetical protein